MNRFLLIIALYLTGLPAGLAQLIETNFETGVIWVAVKDEATHDMIRAALREKDPLSRVQALAALQAMQDPTDMALIAGMTNDPVPAVREQAIHAPPTQESSPLLDLDHSLDQSTAAAEIRDGLSHSNLFIQQAAVDTVGRHHLAPLAPALLPLLQSPDSVLRRHVCEALGKTSDDQGTALAAQLSRDDDPLVRRAAAEALLALYTDADRDALVALLKDPKAPVRVEALKVLGKWGQPVVATAVTTVLLDHEPTVARAAATALGKLGNPDSKQPLLDALKPSPYSVQEQIVWALGELHAQEAVPALEPLLQSPSEFVQSFTAEALGKIGDKHPIPLLQKALVDMRAHGPLTRQHSLEALRRLGDRDSLKRVMQIVTEKVVPPAPGETQWSYDAEETRAEAVRYLEFIGDPALVTEMLGKLKDMPTYPLRKVMASMITQLTGQPHMAAFSYDARRYWVESLAEGVYPKGPTPPGIVPVAP